MLGPGCWSQSKARSSLQCVEESCWIFPLPTHDIHNVKGYIPMWHRTRDTLNIAWSYFFHFLLYAPHGIIAKMGYLAYTLHMLTNYVLVGPINK